MERSHKDLVASSVLAWITSNKFVNENLKPIEFTKHRFLIDYIADQHPIKITIKAAQVGLTVAETLDNFYLAGFKDMNVIHTLQTKDVIKGFVFPKVNPIINNNPAIKELVTIDSEGLKQIGNAFIYYRGANAESQAINISADVLKIDEYDRSNPQVVAMYPSRLDASAYGWKRYFSNPSMVGFGVDGMYNQSNQYHWFIRCHHCNHWWFIDYEQDDENKRHYVDEKNSIFSCGKCHKDISDSDRQNGEWVAKYDSREWHGYWFSQLMAPWINAKNIIDKRNDMPVDVFYNMVLGKAYTPTDLIVNRETILRACAPSLIQKIHVAMGVDQAADGQYYVLMTAQGVFEYGKTKSWEEIERIKLTYNATVVCDQNPYPTMPKQLATKYPDWYNCIFKESKTMDILVWKGQMLYADRTRLIDTVAMEITQAKMLFRQRPMELEAYIADWQNIYRTTKEEDDGRTKSVWMKKENKNSDYSFATCYARAALTQLMNGENSMFIEPEQVYDTKITDELLDDGLTETTLTGMVQETFEQMDE